MNFTFFFKNVNTNNIPNTNTDNEATNVPVNEFLNANITNDEIIKCTNNSKNGKFSSNFDKITNEYISKHH